MYLKFLNNERVDGREDIGLHIEKKLFVRRLGGGGGFFTDHGQTYSHDDCCHFDHRKHLPIIK